MNTLVHEQAPAAVNESVSNGQLTVSLADGRTLSVPIAWYPRLAAATPDELVNWQLLGDGYAVEWPALDEHFGIEGLLAGRRSGESDASFERWLATRCNP